MSTKEKEEAQTTAEQPSEAPVMEAVQEQTMQPAAQPEKVPEFLSLTEAIALITKQYERNFPKLTFNTPMQIIDGGVAEFIDASMNVTVATARIRIRNQLIVDNKSGIMYMAVQLSDLTFSKPQINVGTQ